MSSTVLATVSAVILAAQLAVGLPSNPTYKLVDDYTSSPDHFFSESTWSYFTHSDPTDGAVKYQSAQSALAKGLIRYVTSGDTSTVGAASPDVPIYIGIDHTSPKASTRDSVRIESVKTYDVGTLLIADIEHAPAVSCSVWPALWMDGADGEWPSSGEIDIFEGVNEDSMAVTLHTSPGCSTNLPQDSYSGSFSSSSCGSSGTDNTGCQIKLDNSTRSVEFNSNGGGVVAMLWTELGITTWLFQDRSKLPSTLLSNSPDPTTFGTPVAKFGGSQCDWKARFRKMRIILNINLGGQWAGQQSVWDQYCAKQTGFSTADLYIASNPPEFADAYWILGSLKVFSQEN